MGAALFCLALLMVLSDHDQNFAEAQGSVSHTSACLLIAYNCLTAACCWQLSLPEASLTHTESEVHHAVCFTFLGSVWHWQLKWLPTDVLEHWKCNREQGILAKATYPTYLKQDPKAKVQKETHITAVSLLVTEDPSCLLLSRQLPFHGLFLSVQSLCATASHSHLLARAREH